MIYLIRHTAPKVAKGICYGQSDLDVMPTFASEAEIIKSVLPNTLHAVYSSPLQRCTKLAKALFAQHTITTNPELMELNCGEWEMQHWDDIPKEIITPWYNDFVNVPIPAGESYTMLYNRVINTFNQITQKHPTSNVAIVAHGGVLRSILSHITNTPLHLSFEAFKLHYGCVIAIQPTNLSFTYDILSNINNTEEQHKPSTTIAKQ